ncbi:MAG: nucleoside-diphosphate sugar epimerase [Candidatus Poribacteria bacterium]|nr:MAG: nucleoside-diphosphate sugar epimerase [Candidatus Poribacteria bacterium]
MKVLVAGATGQVGSRLVRQLLDRNHEVRAIVLPDDPAASRIEGLEIERMEGDLRDETLVEKAVAGVDAVIHTANFVSGAQFENNTQVNRVLANVCGKYADRLERYVYVSSSGVFPNNGEVIACAYHPVDELHPKRPLGDYNISKILGEHFTESVAYTTGLRTVIVRPSHILSGTAILHQFSVRRVCGILRTGQRNRGSELYMPDGTELWHQVEAQAESEDQPCSVRDLEGRPWYYQPNDARDIAHGLICALEEPGAVGESFNLGAPAPFTFPEAARRIAEATGQEPLEIRLPVRWRYDHDIRKAKSWINYRPQGDLPTMIASALRVQSEGWQDYTWE